MIRKGNYRNDSRATSYFQIQDFRCIEKSNQIYSDSTPNQVALDK
uniref:Uncharacterized protein n=1 Tax=Arundo donax TaxID=35708 RepID=A0A0A9C6J7_ARUDO